MYVYTWALKSKHNSTARNTTTGKGYNFCCRVYFLQPRAAALATSCKAVQADQCYRILLFEGLFWSASLS